MRDLPTATNGRCPPRMEKVELFRLAYAIGAGTKGDPVRLAVAYYNGDGQHMFTFDDNTLIAWRGHDAIRGDA